MKIVSNITTFSISFTFSAQDMRHDRFHLLLLELGLQNTIFLKSTKGMAFFT